MSDTSTKRALVVAKFHEVSEELYADNPEDSGRRAMHHMSAKILRALAGERDALRAAIEMALECIEDVDVIGARQILAKALGEKE